MEYVNTFKSNTPRVSSRSGEPKQSNIIVKYKYKYHKDII